jgi:hypothetical protein
MVILTICINNQQHGQKIDQYSKDDYIVVKVDIEGTEFPLFEHFLRQGTINKIDYIAMEFHDIYKNQTFLDKIKFYKTYLETVNKPYSQWFMGHGPLLRKHSRRLIISDFQLKLININYR